MDKTSKNPNHEKIIQFFKINFWSQNVLLVKKLMHIVLLKAF
jgi:hypothetical protein